MDIYAANIMDHYKNPRNYGALEGDCVSRHEANITCGDVVDLDVEVVDGVLKRIGFEGDGCALSQAGASILFDELIGENVDFVLSLRKEDLVEMLGVDITARRMKCAVLGLLALQNALLKFSGEKEKSFADILI